MEQLKALIIEDERHNQEALTQLLHSYCPLVQLVGVASSVAEGLQALQEEQPDLVFLDIEMPDGSGFDLLQRVEEPNFQVIFTTAYEQYAIRAFKFSAIDYLLKPIDIEELEQAVAKVKPANLRHEADDRIDMLLESILPGQKSSRMALATQTGFEFVEISQLVRLEADGIYTNIYLVDGQKILVSKNLKEFEELLHPYRFFRVHHSHLINLDRIKSYIRGEGGYLVMEDEATVAISRRKKEDFMKQIMKV